MNSMEVPEEGVNRQTVKCEVHDLHYNPSLRAGCVLCLREERRGETSRRMRLALLAVLCVVFFVTAFHQATRSGDGGSDLLASASGGPSDGKTDPNRALGARLDPEPDRAEVEAVEGVLYQRAPASEGDLESDQQPVAEIVDPSVVASLQLVENDIYHLVRVGRLESDAIGEILGDADNDPETARIRQRWNEWRRDWARQVQRAAKRMPPPPSMTSNINLLVAYQKTVSALSNLSLVAVSGGDEPVPYLYQRRSRFEAAEREAEEAETRLKSLVH